MPNPNKMDPEAWDRWREANAMKARKCKRCGGTPLYIVDGKDCGGLPGLNYKVCNNCGNSDAITKRPRREKLT